MRRLSSLHRKQTKRRSSTRRPTARRSRSPPAGSFRPATRASRDDRNGVYASRYGANGFGASILGNYGQGAAPGNSIVETAENLQGRIRYDRYVLDHMSLFLLLTGRHDKFQGLDFRINIDPGVKYIFVDEKATSFWGEAGYDFQHDIRDQNDLAVIDATTMVQAVDPTTGQLEYLTRTATDNSARLFVGLRHAFNDAVTFSTGLEYLSELLREQRPVQRRRDRHRLPHQLRRPLRREGGGGLVARLRVQRAVRPPAAADERGARHRHEREPHLRVQRSAEAEAAVHAVRSAVASRRPPPPPPPPPPPAASAPPPPPPAAPADSGAPVTPPPAPSAAPQPPAPATAAESVGTSAAGPQTRATFPPPSAAFRLRQAKA